MKVYFIGAGPGDPELITRKGWRILQACPIILYTGSLVPKDVIPSATGPDAPVIIDSASLNLDEICDVFAQAKLANQDVARLHTGDPTIFASVAEQMRRLAAMNVPYEMIPGVSSFTAASACLKKELTLPAISQTVILTRVEGRTKMPAGETLAELARHRSTLVLFLSITLLPKVCKELLPILGEYWPIAIVAKASIAKQERILQGRLGNILAKWKETDIKSQAIIILGQVLESTDFEDSRLYDPDFFHSYRPRKTSDKISK